MWCQQKQSIRDRRTDSRTTAKVIPMLPFASLAPQKSHVFFIELLNFVVHIYWCKYKYWISFWMQIGLIIPSQQRWRGYSNAAVRGWLGEWVRWWVGESVTLYLVDMIVTTVFAQSLSNFPCKLWMMRGGTLLIWGHRVKGQGQLWHSVYKTLWTWYRLQVLPNHFQTYRLQVLPNHFQTYRLHVLPNHFQTYRLQVLPNHFQTYRLQFFPNHFQTYRLQFLPNHFQTYRLQFFPKSLSNLQTTGFAQSLSNLQTAVFAQSLSNLQTAVFAQSLSNLQTAHSVSHSQICDPTRRKSCRTHSFVSKKHFVYLSEHLFCSIHQLKCLHHVQRIILTL